MVNIIWDADNDQQITGCVDRITEGLVKGLVDGAMYVEAEVKRMAPVDTGDYRSKIRSDPPVFTDEGVYVMIGSPSPQARQLEWGGTIHAKNGEYLKFQINGHWVQVVDVFQHAQPHWRPAFDLTRERVKQIIAAEARRETANG